MATIPFPSSIAPAEFEMGTAPVTWEWPTLAGSSTTLEMPGARWTMMARWREIPEYASGEMQAFLLRLRGRANRFTCHKLTRPVPVGTYRGSPTVAASLVQGASSVTLNSTSANASKTLLQGDMIGLGSQVVMVAESATANASGQITFNFESPLRNAIAAGAAAVWDRPLITYILDEEQSAWSHAEDFIVELSVSAREWWA